MSHSYTARHGTHFNFNGDFSGEVTVHAPGPAESNRPTIAIPAADLLELAAEAVRRRRISALESATPDELLFDGDDE